MSSVNPNVRLQQTANRLLAEHPDPPRPVSLLVVLGIYAPVVAGLASVLIALLIAFIAIRPETGASSIVPFAALLVAGGALYASGLMGAVWGPLQKGFGATGEVTAVGSSTVKVNVTIDGRVVEMSYLARIAFRKPGDRLSLLVDKEKSKIMLVLGTAPT